MYPIVIMIFSGNAFAQGKMAVSGKITDAAGEPLPGAAVVVKGTSVGVSSDPVRVIYKYRLN